jgi:beta-glucosidase
LKGFKALTLAAGESKTVSFELGRDAFSFYDPAQSGWVLEPGKFQIQIGRSTQDIELKKTIKLTDKK